MVALCEHFIDRADAQFLRELELLLQGLAPPIELVGHAIEFDELPRRGLRLIPARKLFAIHGEKLQFIRHHAHHARDDRVIQDVRLVTR